MTFSFMKKVSLMVSVGLCSR